MAGESNIGCLAEPLDLSSDDPFRSGSFLNDRRPMQGRFSAPARACGTNYVSLQPFVNDPWRPVFRVHIMCYSVGLSWRHEENRKHVSLRLLIKGNPSAYINLSFLRDQGHNT
jgi:hypothetical protein